MYLDQFFLPAVEVSQPLNPILERAAALEPLLLLYHGQPTNKPTIYLPQLKQIAIRTLQTTAEGYQRSHIRLNEPVAYTRKPIANAKVARDRLARQRRILT